MTTGRGRSPFADALRRAIGERGLPLDRIQERMREQGVSVGRSTLSVWQNGRRTPTGPESLAAVVVLERVLGVPPQSLTVHLSAPPAAGEASLNPCEQATALLDRIDCADVPPRFRIRASATRLVVGATGAIERFETHVVLRALRPSSRFAFLYGTEPGGRGELLHPTVEGSSWLGRTAVEGDVLAAEVILEREVASGELVSLRYGVRDGNGLASECFLRHSDGGGVLSVIDVDFHPDRRPASVVEFERVTAQGPDLAARELVLGAGRHVQVVRERDRRGVLGVRWSFL